MTRRRCIAMGGLPVLAGLGAHALRNHGPLGTDDAPRFQPVGPASAREEIQRRHLPNVPLVTHDGSNVRFYDDLVKDKKVVLTFFSRRALRDSRHVTSNLATLQRFFGSRVGRDMFIYTIARDPERDSQAVARNWAARSGAGSGWTFLTGRPADVELLRRSLGFASPDPAEDADPAFAVGQLRHGVEPEMRWAHCEARAEARVIAHSMLLDFGAGPADPGSPEYWTFRPDATSTSSPIWNCERLLAGI